MSTRFVGDEDWQRPSNVSLAILAILGLGSLLAITLVVGASMRIVVPAVLVGLVGACAIPLTAEETLGRRTVGLLGMVLTAFGIAGVLDLTLTAGPIQGALAAGSTITAYGLTATVTGALRIETSSTAKRRLLVTVSLLALWVVGGVLLAQNGVGVAMEFVGTVTSGFLEPGPQPGDPAAFALSLALAVRAVRYFASRLDVATLLTPANRERYEAFAGVADASAHRAFVTLLVAGSVLGVLGLTMDPRRLGGTGAIGSVLGPLVDFLFLVSTPTVLVAILGVAIVSLAGTVALSVTGRIRGTSSRHLVRAVVPPAAVAVVVVGTLAVLGGHASAMVDSVSGIEFVRTFRSQMGYGHLLQSLSLGVLLAYTVTVTIADWLVRYGVLPRTAAGSAVASVGLFLTCPIVVLAGSPETVPILTVAGLLLWDVGEHGGVLATELGARAPKLRLELVHLGLSVTVGLALLGLVTVVNWFVGSLGATPAHATAFVALLGATFAFLFYAMYLWD